MNTIAPSSIEIRLPSLRLLTDSHRVPDGQTATAMPSPSSQAQHFRDAWHKNMPARKKKRRTSLLAFHLLNKTSPRCTGLRATPASSSCQQSKRKGRLWIHLNRMVKTNNQRKMFLAASVAEALISANSHELKWADPKRPKQFERLVTRLYTYASHPDVWAVKCTQLTGIGDQQEYTPRIGNVKAAVRQIAVGEGTWNALRAYIHVALYELMSGRAVSVGSDACVARIGSERFGVAAHVVSQIHGVPSE